jgi:large subunit ribosomal protein L14
MICKQSRLKIIDNSGAKVVKVFHIFSLFSKKNCTRIGGRVLGSAIEIKANRKVSKKQLCNVLIISTKKNFLRANGNFIRCDENRGIVLSESQKILGTRIFGPIIKEVRLLNSRLLLTADKII